MINEFGQQVYLSSGEINKPFLSKLIFHDKKELEKVNQIIHPRVKEHFLRWLKEHNSASYVIKEAAILFESGAYKQTDKVISVVAPTELRVQRVMQRDGIDEALVKKKIANQMQQSELIERSDFVIVNDEKQPLLSQVIKIHNYLYDADI
jgi:dephospho-CoA kinase